MKSFLLLTFTSFCLLVQGQNEKVELIIHFKGLEKAQGHVMFKVSDKEGEKVKAAQAAVDGKEVDYSLKLMPGTYAIASFHDKNGNKEMDKNAMGIPQEKYGFSNDARGTMGPPGLEEQLFELSESKEISITLQ